MKNNILEELKRMKALVDTGLLYAANDYEKERYIELQEICFRLLQTIGDHPLEELKESFPQAKDYPTAKVDIRGFILSPDKKILLVKESADGKWSLPGGWADVGFTPEEIIIKEVKEETGLALTVQKLLAVFDKRKHPHPPQPFYIYKLVFYGVVASGEIRKGFDVLDVDYFSINELPPLSEDRILKSQIELLYQKVMAADFEAHFE